MRSRRWVWALGGCLGVCLGVCLGAACAAPDAPGPAAEGGSDAAAPDGRYVPTPTACFGASPRFKTCGGLCGNARRDDCVVTFGAGDQQRQSVRVTEPCDAADLGEATCASLKYGGGTLRCHTTCDYDTGDCDACARGGSIVACGRVAADTVAPEALSLAATDNAVALAWVAETAPGGGATVHVALYTRDFARIAHTTFATECFAPLYERRVAIAAVPTGWILAVQGGAGVTVRALDAQGGARGAARVVPGANQPALTARPGAGPLFVWEDEGVHAALLNEDGTEATAPVVAFRAALDGGGGVFVGDGFLLAQRDGAGQGVAVARIDLAGRLVSVTHPVGSTSEYAQIAWTGSEARLVYSDFGNPTNKFWVPLDRDGAAIGARVPLAKSYFGTCPVYADGADTVVLLAGYSVSGEATGLDAMRIGPAGATVTEPFHVSQSPTQQSSQQMVRQGTDAVVAWIEGSGQWSPWFSPYGDPGRIQLARIRP